jgi:hypothetical protein
MVLAHRAKTCHWRDFRAPINVAPLRRAICPMVMVRHLAAAKAQPMLMMDRIGNALAKYSLAPVRQKINWLFARNNNFAGCADHSAKCRQD